MFIEKEEARERTNEHFTYTKYNTNLNAHSVGM